MLQPGRQALDHGTDRLLALLRREAGHRLLLLAAGLGHAGGGRHAFDLGAQHCEPRRTGRAGSFERLPARESGRRIAALGLVQAEIVAGAGVVGLQRQRLGEGRQCILCHRAAGFQHHCFAPGRQGIVGGTVSHLLRSEGRRRQAGAAGMKVDPQRQQRHQQRQRRRQQAVQGRGLPWPVGFRGVGRSPLGRSKNSSLDFQAGGGGLGLGHGAGGAVALDLGQLVAIDGERAVEPFGAPRRRAQQRHQQRPHGGGGQECQEEFEHDR